MTPEQPPDTHLEPFISPLVPSLSLPASPSTSDKMPPMSEITSLEDAHDRIRNLDLTRHAMLSSIENFKMLVDNERTMARVTKRRLSLANNKVQEYEQQTSQHACREEQMMDRFNQFQVDIQERDNKLEQSMAEVETAANELNALKEHVFENNAKIELAEKQAEEEALDMHHLQDRLVQQQSMYTSLQSTYQSEQRHHEEALDECKALTAQLDESVNDKQTLSKRISGLATQMGVQSEEAVELEFSLQQQIIQHQEIVVDLTSRVTVETEKVNELTKAVSEVDILRNLVRILEEDVRINNTVANITEQSKENATDEPQLFTKEMFSRKLSELKIARVVISEKDKTLKALRKELIGTEEREREAQIARNCLETHASELEYTVESLKKELALSHLQSAVDINLVNADDIVKADDADATKSDVVNNLVCNVVVDAIDATIATTADADAALINVDIADEVVKLNTADFVNSDVVAKSVDTVTGTHAYTVDATVVDVAKLIVAHVVDAAIADAINAAEKNDPVDADAVAINFSDAVDIGSVDAVKAGTEEAIDCDTVVTFNPDAGDNDVVDVDIADVTDKLRAANEQLQVTKEQLNEVNESYAASMLVTERIQQEHQQLYDGQEELQKRYEATIEKNRSMEREVEIVSASFASAQKEICRLEKLRADSEQLQVTEEQLQEVNEKYAASMLVTERIQQEHQQLCNDQEELQKRYDATIEKSRNVEREVAIVSASFASAEKEICRLESIISRNGLGAEYLGSTSPCSMVTDPEPSVPKSSPSTGQLQSLADLEEAAALASVQTKFLQEDRAPPLGEANRILDERLKVLNTTTEEFELHKEMASKTRNVLETEFNKTSDKLEGTLATLTTTQTKLTASEQRGSQLECEIATLDDEKRTLLSQLRQLQEDYEHTQLSLRRMQIQLTYIESTVAEHEQTALEANQNQERMGKLLIEANETQEIAKKRASRKDELSLHLLSRCGELERNHAVVNDHLGEMSENVKRRDSALEEAEKVINLKDEALREQGSTSREREARFEALSTQLKTVVLDKEDELRVTNQEYAALERGAKLFSESLTSTTTQLHNCEEELLTGRMKLTNCEADIRRKDRKLEEAQEEYIHITAEYRALQESLLSLEVQRAFMARETAEQTLNKTTAELSLLEKSTTVEIEDLNRTIATLRKVLGEKESSLSTASEAITQNAVESNLDKEQLIDSRRRGNRLFNRLSSAEDELASKKEEVSTLQGRLWELQETFNCRGADVDRWEKALFDEDRALSTALSKIFV